MRRIYPAELLDALRRAADRGARVLSVCSGVFVLGAAGLLDGRRCTVHWRHAEELARQYPRAIVEPDVLYVDADPVITSAGTAAGIDACLHIVRKEQGPEVANEIARRMVVPPHRDGGQAQYIERPLPRSQCDTVGEVLVWMEQHLDEEVTVEQLAARAHMSPRTFARRFQQETGTTPYRWILRQRVLLAQRLLEATDETVDAIAGRTGFGTAAALRHQFVRSLGTTPQAPTAGRSGARRPPERTPVPPTRARLSAGSRRSSSRSGCRVMPTRVASSDPGTCSKRYFLASSAVMKREHGHREVVARALAVAHAERAHRVLRARP